MKSISMAALAMMGGALLSGAAQAQHFTVQIDSGVGDYGKSTYCYQGSYCDARNDFLRVHLGYRFANGVGIELARSSYGEMRTNMDNSRAGLVNVTNLSLSASYGVAIWGDLGLVARLGLAHQRASLERRWGDYEGPEHHFRPQAGLGLTYTFSSAWRLELGVDMSSTKPFRNEIYDTEGSRRLRAYYLGTQFSF